MMNPNTLKDLLLETTIQAKAMEWLAWDKNPETNAEIRAIYETPISAHRTARLNDLLLCRLEFGTAGLRGPMQAGYSCMNDLVIIQTTQGLVKYIESLELKNAKERGVVIGMDGRHNSKRFAALTAGILLGRGFRVYLFSQVCPTPFVPFCVKEKDCVAGIMVTASHNPKNDNGYKVYWENSAQIIPPHDKYIHDNILANLAPWAKAWDLSVLENNPLLEDPLDIVSASYYKLLQESMVSLKTNKDAKVRITYSAMHGVGYPYMEEAFKTAHLQPLIPVLEQRDPDPDFPTVKFPNPEEKRALNLAIATAEKNNSLLILANDPDADRLAVAEWDKTTKSWVIFSGNQVGALLGWWMLYSYKTRNPTADCSKLCMLGSTVSSKIIDTMAKVDGFKYVETLTGFKWMGNKAVQLKEEGNTVLFAFEEAIGYMCGTSVLDKDGISAGVYMAELASYLHTQGMAVNDKLRELYQKYGHHLGRNSYFFCRDYWKIEKLFYRLRNFEGKPNTYPKSLCKGKYTVKYVRDLTTGYDSSQPDGKAILPVSKANHMITFTFDNNFVATIRTSGTEPKVKFYTEIIARKMHGVLETLEEMVGALIDEFLQPEENGLEHTKK